MARYIDERNVQSSPQGFNAETEKIAQTQQDHLSRKPVDGPNQMETDLDMNGHRVYNLPEPQSDHEPLTLGRGQSILDESTAQANRAENEADRSEQEANKAAQSAQSASSDAALLQASLDDKQDEINQAASSSIQQMEVKVGEVDTRKNQGIQQINSFQSQTESASASAIQSIQQAEADTQGALDDAIDRIITEGEQAAASTGWFIVGEFADGFKFTARNQVGRDSTGELWSYNGDALPFIVTAGTIPSEPTYTNRGDAALRSEFEKGKSVKGYFAAGGSAMRESLSSKGGISFGAGSRRPMVSFIDDDGYAGVMTKVKPLYDSKGITAGVAVPTARIGTWSFMTWDDVQTLVDAGWELLSHTQNNVNFGDWANPLDPNAIEAELRDSRKDLEDRGYNVYSFVPVQGGDGGFEGRKLIRNYYRASFITKGTIQPDSFSNYPVCRIDAVAQTVGANPTLQQLKDAVDEAVAQNKWVVFTTHANYAGFNAAQEQVISDLIDYIQGLGVEIVNPNDALDVHGNLIDVGDDTVQGLLSANARPYFKLDREGVMWPKKEQFVFTSGAETEPNAGTPLTDYEPNCVTYFRSTADMPDMPNAATWGGASRELANVIRTVHLRQSNISHGYQELVLRNTDRSFVRSWNTDTETWGPWVETSANSFYRRSDGFTGETPLTDYRPNSKTVFRTDSGQAGWPTSAIYIVETTYHHRSVGEQFGWQIAFNISAGEQYNRAWINSTSSWGDWIQVGGAAGGAATVLRFPSEANDANPPNTLSIAGFSNTTAPTYGMPEDSAGTLMGVARGQGYQSYQTYHVYLSNRMYIRYWDAVASEWGPWTLMSGGATGTFESQDGKTVTVTNGLITSIV